MFIRDLFEGEADDILCNEFEKKGMKNLTDIHDSYREAGRLHGHFCPGLAFGVRAGYIAAEYLGVETGNNKNLYCIYEKPACYVDGIQWTFGTTTGKGNLIYHPAGKAAFSFYDTESGKNLRLSMKRIEKQMSKEELIEYILTGPREDLFSFSDAFLPCPKAEPAADYAVCRCCGEETEKNKLIERDGKLLCIDCAEK